MQDDRLTAKMLFVWFAVKVYLKLRQGLYRQIVGIPVGTNCAPLVADLFLFCCERDFMLSRSEDTECDVIEAFTYTTR